MTTDRDLTAPSAFQQRNPSHGSGLPLFHPKAQAPAKFAAETPSTARKDDCDTPVSNDEDDAEQVDDECVTEPSKSMITVTIGEGLAVEQFLRSRLKGMQQLAVKKIAKAWIRGICPKKQGSFPYRRNKGKLRIPAWWPPTNLCRFTEPDHIKRSGESTLPLCMSHSSTRD